jgi:hypothetical protein
MNISNQLLKRKIYNQTGYFSWSADFRPEELKSLEFGFSGDGGVLSWRISDNKIFDSAGLFLYSFDKTEDLFLSGDVSALSDDFFINDSFAYIANPKSSNNYSYFYLDCSGEVDINFNILGVRPSGFDDSGSGTSYNIFESYIEGQSIYAALSNFNDFPVHIFSGDSDHANFVFSTGEFPRDISAGGTENFEISVLNFTNSQQAIPLTFYTDFGDFSYELSASGILVSDLLYYLFLGPEQKTITNGSVNKYNAYFYNTSGSNINVTLDYISGITGEVYYSSLESRFLSGFDVSGYITGLGNLCSYITGLVSGYDDLLTKYQTGIGSGEICFSNFYATGYFESGYSLTFCVPGSGIIGVPYTATGYSDVFVSGFITQTDKTLSFNNASGIVTGYDSFGNILTGYIESGDGTIPYGGPGIESAVLTGDFDETEYETFSYFSGPIFATGDFSKFVALSGIAIATGGRIYGQLKGPFARYYEPGFWTFYKDYSGVGSGEAFLDIDGFEPIEGKWDKEYAVNVTGLISKSVESGILIDYCEFELPEFPLVGFANQYGRADNGRIVPSFFDVITSGLIPRNSLESYVNNSNYLISNPTFTGTITIQTGELSGVPLYGELVVGPNGLTPSGGRYRISRLGAGVSGSGYFSDPVRLIPTGEGFSYSGLSPDLGWGEKLINGSITGDPSFGDYGKFSIGGDLFFENKYDNFVTHFTVEGPRACYDVAEANFAFNVPPKQILDLKLYRTGAKCTARNLSSPTSTQILYSNQSSIGLYDPFIYTGSNVYLDSSFQVFDWDCSGVGCTGIGPYSGFASGLTTCYEDSDLFILNFSGSTTGLVDISAGYGAVWSSKVGSSGQQYVSSRSYAYGAKLSNEKPYFGPSEYDYYACYGEGCTGVGYYIGEIIYSQSNHSQCVSTGRRILFEGNCTSRTEDGTYINLEGSCALNTTEIVTHSGVERKYDCEVGDETTTFNCVNLEYLFYNGIGRLSGAPFEVEGQEFYSGITGFDVNTYPDRTNWTVLGPGAEPGGEGEYSGYVFYDGLTGYTGQVIPFLGENQSLEMDTYYFFRGLVEKDPKKMGLSSGVLKKYACTSSVFESSVVFSQVMTSGDQAAVGLDGGDYSLYVNLIEDWKEPVNVQVPNYSMIYFSHPVFTGCEENRSIWFKVLRSGDLSYEYSGDFSVKRPVDMDHWESNEILTGGLQAYDTLLPFVMPPYAKAIYVRVPLEDEGDWEDDEGVDLTIEAVSSNPYILIHETLNQARLIVKDDDNPNAVPCTPTIEPPPSSSCGAIFGDCVGYCGCLEFNYPPGYGGGGGGGGGGGSTSYPTQFPSASPVIRPPRRGPGGPGGPPSPSKKRPKPTIGSISLSVTNLTFDPPAGTWTECSYVPRSVDVSFDYQVVDSSPCPNETRYSLTWSNNYWPLHFNKLNTRYRHTASVLYNCYDDFNEINPAQFCVFIQNRQDPCGSWYEWKYWNQTSSCQAFSPYAPPGSPC